MVILWLGPCWLDEKQIFFCFNFDNIYFFVACLFFYSAHVNAFIEKYVFLVFNQYFNYLSILLCTPWIARGNTRVLFLKILSLGVLSRNLNSFSFVESMRNLGASGKTSKRSFLTIHVMLHFLLWTSVIMS